MGSWRPDALLPGFEALELALADDDEGAVVATLVRLPGGEAPRGPVLYVHGFSDYFFQRHMAERFAAEGYAFHALDLRKYGRSLRPWQHPNFCRDLRDYYPELDAAMEAIGAPLLLAAHSTGGLLCPLYLQDGARRAAVRALWLNSPFFEWRDKSPAALLQRSIAEWMGLSFPYVARHGVLDPRYHRALLAEWEFDLRLKPLRGQPVHFGWVRAINAAHRRLQQGISLACPVLSMHSDEADVVLDWRDIARWSRTLGPQVTVLQFPGAVHDLVLSTAGVREAVFSALFAWAERIEA